MAVEVRAVKYGEILGAPNWPELLVEYAAECSLPELGPVNPQAGLYEGLERSGGFQAFGAFDDARLVGFVTVLEYPLPHYGGKKIAATESLFLARAYRNQGIWPRMMAVVKGFAKSRGCATVQCTAPVGSRFARLMELNRTQYRKSNVVYLWSL